MSTNGSQQNLQNDKLQTAKIGTQDSAIDSIIKVYSIRGYITYNKTTSRCSTKENVGLETKMTNDESKPTTTGKNKQDDVAKKTTGTGL